MKFLRRNILVIVFFILCLLTSYAIGRAGGGGGHGGGGGGGGFGGGHGSSGNGTFSPLTIFIGICWIIYTSVTSIMLYLRLSQATNLLNQISEQDRMWQPELLRENARTAFLNLQSAWQERNMNKVKKIVTTSLYDSYTLQLNEMRSRRETNYISDITIFDIKIISCQDYKDNAQDRYIAHIRGNLLDYTMNDLHKSIVKNPAKENEDFEDAFYFIRSGNKWLLEDINNDPGFWVLADAKSHKEN